MDLTAIAEMDQRTIGPTDLGHFLDVINVLDHDGATSVSTELGEIAHHLQTSLEAWNRSLVRFGLGADTVVSVNGGNVRQNEPSEPSEAGANLHLAALRAIDAHLSRLILRHSNFGFAAANDPSMLDEHFPGDALHPIRIARPLLRRAIRDLDTVRA